MPVNTMARQAHQIQADPPIWALKQPPGGHLAGPTSRGFPHWTPDELVRRSLPGPRRRRGRIEVHAPRAFFPLTGMAADGAVRSGGCGARIQHLPHGQPDRIHDPKHHGDQFAAVARTDSDYLRFIMTLPTCKPRLRAAIGRALVEQANA